MQTPAPRTPPVAKHLDRFDHASRQHLARIFASTLDAPLMRQLLAAAQEHAAARQREYRP
jgi:hypothetical protein